MTQAVRRKRRIQVEENLVDRVIGYFSPERGRRRYIARASQAIIGGYIGASRTRRSTKEWNPHPGDADSDTLYDLPVLRARSRDLIRNDPLAAGAILTKITHIVGSGLKLQARIDREILGMTDEEADQWEAHAEREWSLFWDSKDVDATRIMKGPALSRMIYRQRLENGDVFIHLPRIRRKSNPYILSLQTIEADRVCNRDNLADAYEPTYTLSGGVKRDAWGAPIEYHILKQHPGSWRSKKREWDVIPAYSNITDLPNIIHLMAPTRPGQARGVPDLAPVIEPLKQLGRYTEAELMAAVVSGLFTVFIETQAGDADLDLKDLEDETGGKASDKDLKLSSGAIVGLGPGEKVSTANPGRPNTSYDPFMKSILRSIGPALGLPYELLIKQFEASYSASRAALNEAWEYFMLERKDFSDDFHRAVYQVFMYEAVSGGRLYAPGYFEDPLIQKAYLGSEWTGPARKPLDEVKEVNAAKERIAHAISTHADEAAQMTGTSFDMNVKQLSKEKKAMQAAGIWIEPGKAANIPGVADQSETDQNAGGAAQ